MALRQNTHGGARGHPPPQGPSDLRGAPASPAAQSDNSKSRLLPGVGVGQAVTHRARPRLKDGFPGLWEDWPPGPTPPSPKPSSSFDPLRLYPAHCIQRAIDLRISKCTRASDSVLGQGQGSECGDQGVQKAGGESRRRWRDDVLVSFAPVWPKAGPGCPPISSCGAGLCDERKDGGSSGRCGAGELVEQPCLPASEGSGLPGGTGSLGLLQSFPGPGEGVFKARAHPWPGKFMFSWTAPGSVIFQLFFEMLKVRGEK